MYKLFLTMDDPCKLLKKRLHKRESDGLLRELRTESSLIDFCSNDYLGFARMNSPVENQNNGTASHGSTGSRLLTGNSIFAEKLESRIAAFHQAEAGLIFNSGYDANLGLFSSVPQRGDVVFYDELAHASIRDGIRLCLAHSGSFRHNDTDDLAKKLEKAQGRSFIAVESVYSMDGDYAPLKKIVELAQKRQAIVIVDEAHASGVAGKSGEGRVVELGLEKDVFARVHTFGKALGCHGAAILGSDELRTFLINFSRPFIYTTALPLNSLKSIEKSYDKLSYSKHIILELSKLVLLFKSKIECVKNVQSTKSFTPIQGIICGGNDRAKAVASALQKDGFDVRPILSPTVPKGTERLRIIIHAFNTENEICGLVESIKGALSL